MTIHVAVQTQTNADFIPDENKITQWVKASVPDKLSDTEVTIRIVDEDEGRNLNKQWRNKDYATNVLSFPIGENIAEVPDILGDIVICAPVVKNEAEQQRKAIDAHWAHLIIHGMLHLQGFDHENSEDADKMEAKEITILSQFGYANPYESSQ